MTNLNDVDPKVTLPFLPHEIPGATREEKIDYLKRQEAKRKKNKEEASFKKAKAKRKKAKNGKR